ncbi:hypothetical protein DEU56DRAFT_759953 [Suillus clintonianus]|uniref:uncharacterized protein n=1 Tax=Suillus clintonianus TaxID=1904413 RepID=UPI001B87B869|nr:uncharacterized protein DEU56DRAFT_759953 [Suillus clintonianus]KAG2123742.1 hypothetical protein DEU56DRAFT_759953 [Suillus clintonianus]
MRIEVDIELIVRNDELDGVANVGNSGQGPYSPCSLATAIMSKAFDDSAHAPPSYDTISSTSVSADSVWCKRSLFSFLQSKRKCRAIALSRIREIVSSPSGKPSWAKFA